MDCHPPLFLNPPNMMEMVLEQLLIFLRMFQCCTPSAIHDQDILNSESTAIDELSIRYSFSMHSDCGDHSFCTQIPVDYFLAANSGLTLPSHILIQGWGL